MILRSKPRKPSAAPPAPPAPSIESTSSTPLARRSPLGEAGSTPSTPSTQSTQSTPSISSIPAAASPAPLFLYSQVAWDDVWQRPQEMAVGLSRMRPVLFFSPVQVHHAAWRLAGKWQALRAGPGGGDLTIASPLIFPGEYKSGVVRAINRMLIAAEARKAVAELERRLANGAAPAAHRLLFATNSPFCDSLVPALAPGAVIYDIIDDFVAFGWAPPDGPRRERVLLDRADLIFTGTNTLLEKKTAGHSNARFIACGVDFERFAAGASQPEPPELKDLPRPILGYMGTISDRLDRRLFEGLARRFPRASVVIIGPVHGSFGPVVEAPNLHYLGLRPSAALPAYAARFDVALMPFAQTEAARAINPVKTLEYLASGCPVVSTPIPDVQRYFNDVVETAEAVDPFLDVVARLLEEAETDPAARAARVARGVARARDRSWSAMCREMEEGIREIDLSTGAK